MARIFLSHSNVDNESAKALDAWLRENGWSDVFFDIDAQRGLAPGQRWQEELRGAADRCEAVVFLISPDWLSSKWCLAEFMLARNLHKKILGVLIKPVDLEELPVEMTAEWQLCDLTGGRDTTVRDENFAGFDADGLSRLKIGLEKAGLDARTFPWPPVRDPGRPPYRGLRPLDADDAAIFFGREAQIGKVLAQLRRLRDERFRGLVVIVGASGAGKSSFLRAGLIPRLRRDDRNFLVMPPIRPQSAAMTGASGLAISLHELAQQIGWITNLATIEDQLAEPDGLARLLLKIQEIAQQEVTETATEELQPMTLILPIDQAEELFNDEGRRESQLLIETLAGVLRPTAPVQLLALLTIRSDRHESLQRVQQFQDIRRDLIDLPPMPATQFKDIIIGPAARSTDAGTRLEIEPLLVDALLEDAKGPGALPILAFTLEQLYRKYGSNGKLALRDYGDFTTKGGGVISAVVSEALKHGDREPKIPSDVKEQQKLLREAFSGLLVALDPASGLAVRRQVTTANVPEHLHPLVTRLTEARVLTKDVKGGIESVEIAHDSVLEGWQPLKDWIQQDREFLVALDRIEQAQQNWLQAGEDESLLIPAGSRLAEAQEWTGKEPKRTTHVRDYVFQSTHYAKRAIRRLRNQRLIATTLAVAATIAAATSILFWRSADRNVQLTEQARAEGEQVVEFLVDIFEISDPRESVGNTITAKEILDRGSERIDEELSEHPLTKARMMATFGRVYRSLGLFDLAQQHHQDAYDIRLRDLGEEHEDTLSSLGALTDLANSHAEFEKMESLAMTSLRIHTTLYGDEDPGVASALSDIATAQSAQGITENAVLYSRQALQIARKSPNVDKEELESYVRRLAIRLDEIGEVEEALSLYEESIQLSRDAFGENHPSVAIALDNLAIFYDYNDEPDKAEPLYRQALALLTEIYGEEHPEVAQTTGNLADFLIYTKAETPESKSSALEEGRTLATRALALNRKARPGHPYIGSNLTSLAVAEELEGRYSNAEKLFREALDAYSVKLSSGNPSVVGAKIDLGNVLLLSNDLDGAERYLLESEAALINAEPAPDLQTDVFEILIELYELKKNPEKIDEYEQKLASLENGD